MTEVLHQQFRTQLQAILSKAQAGQLRKSLGGATKAQQQKQKRDWLAALLAWAAFDDAMRKALAPIIYALMVETGKSAIQEVGMDPSQFNPTALDVLNYSQQRAQKIADDVNDETEKQLRASLSQGIDNGEDDNQLQARVEEVMGAALTYRTARIVRTETARAQGFADISAWKQSGVVTGKEWVVQSNNPCPFCLSLDGVIVSLDSNFYNLGDVITAEGKTLAINYDNIPSQPVHVNCQCGLLAVTIT
jgi:hypothetical protein